MTPILFNAINDVLESAGRATRARFEPEVRFAEDLNFDSLDYAELAVRLEETLGWDVFKAGVPVTVGEVGQRLAAKASG